MLPSAPPTELVVVSPSSIDYDREEGEHEGLLYYLSIKISSHHSSQPALSSIDSRLVRLNSPCISDFIAPVCAPSQRQQQDILHTVSPTRAANLKISNNHEASISRTAFYIFLRWPNLWFLSICLYVLPSFGQRYIEYEIFAHELADIQRF